MQPYTTFMKSLYDTSSNQIKTLLDPSEVAFIQNGQQIDVVPKDHINLPEITGTKTIDGITTYFLDNGDRVEITASGPHRYVDTHEKGPSKNKAENPISKRGPAATPESTDPQVPGNGLPADYSTDPKKVGKNSKAKSKAASKKK